MKDIWFGLVSWNNFENFLHLFHFLSNQILKIYQNTISTLTWKYSYYGYPLLSAMLCMRCFTCINQLNELYENSFHFTNEKISSEKLSSTEVTRKHREQNLKFIQLCNQQYCYYARWIIFKIVDFFSQIISKK